MDPKLHPFYNCHTGHKIIIELSKLLKDTGYLVLLPECSSKLEYYVTATKAENFGIEDANGKFVVFSSGKFGCAMVDALNCDITKTNWPNYENILLGKLGELIELIKVGKNAIKIQYLIDDMRSIPKVDIVFCNIVMDIKLPFQNVNHD